MDVGLWMRSTLPLSVVAAKSFASALTPDDASIECVTVQASGYFSQLSVLSQGVGAASKYTHRLLEALKELMSLGFLGAFDIALHSR